MNNILIAGRLGADPEVRFTSSGQKVTTLRVASNSRRSGKEETIWWKVTIWGDQFDKMLQYFSKGSAIMVVGEMSKPEIFTDREGKPQVSVNVTANNLMFSPFGRADKIDGEGQSQEKPMTQPASQQNHAFTGAQASPATSQSGTQAAGFSFGGQPAQDFQPSQATQGQGPSNFSDDEIPF